jgi:hypothetical protein
MNENLDPTANNYNLEEFDKKSLSSIFDDFADKIKFLKI